MPTTPKYLPFFTYGTLRPSCGNYRRLLADYVIDEQDAVLRGYALYTPGPFPYAVPERGVAVTGTLLTINPAAYTEVLRSLDQLEGYLPDDLNRSHYVRVARAVEVPFMGFATELVGAWIYQAGPAVDVSAMRPIVGGDWLAHRTG